MFVNYYEVLGVPVTASFDEIKEAFRKKVKECHPDRGGTHEQMVLLNEAYYILSDSAKRIDYDKYLNSLKTGSPDKEIKKRVTKDQKEARDKATKSPLTKDNVDAFFSQLRADFKRTQYHKGEVKGSSSSNYFTIAAYIATAALIFLVLSISEDGLESKKANKAKFALSRIIVFVIPGAFFLIHRLVGYILNLFEEKKDQKSKEIGSKKIIVVCQCCGQKIRCPALYKKLYIKCPMCKSEFEMYGIGNIVYSNTKDNGNGIKELPRWLYILICAICFIIILIPVIAILIAFFTK